VFLTAPKFIDLPKDPISVKVTAISGTEFDFTFRSSAFHHQVQFELEGVPHRAEENFFELYPDEPYTIRVRTARPTTAAKLQKLVVTRSLSGTY
jgi:beta-mannosidase